MVHTIQTQKWICKNRELATRVDLFEMCQSKHLTSHKLKWNDDEEWPYKGVKLLWHFVIITVWHRAQEECVCFCWVAIIAGFTIQLLLVLYIVEAVWESIYRAQVSNPPVLGNICASSIRPLYLGHKTLQSIQTVLAAWSHAFLYSVPFEYICKLWNNVVVLADTSTLCQLVFPW